MFLTSTARRSPFINKIRTEKINEKMILAHLTLIEKKVSKILRGDDILQIGLRFEDYSSEYFRKG